MGNLFDSVDQPSQDQGQSQNLFDSVPQSGSAPAGNLFDAPPSQTPWWQTVGQALNPIVPSAALFNPAVAQQGFNNLSQAGERYPQGIVQSAQDLQQGKSPDVLQNFFSPNPNPKDATTIAQDIGDKFLPPAVISNPDSHLDYMKAYATNFIKDLPFSTAGAISEFANPNSALMGGAIAHMPNVNIPAPVWVDSAVQKLIGIAGGPFSALNDYLKNKLSDHLADVIHDKVSNAPGWMDQFKSMYGQDTTSDDVKDLIKNKIDIAVQNEDPSAIDLAKTIIKVKGANLPGVMIPSKEIAPPGRPITADEWSKYNPEAPLSEVPLSQVVPGTIDTVGPNGKTSTPVNPMNGPAFTAHLSSVQSALDTVQSHEMAKAQALTDSGIPTPSPQTPRAENLEPVLQLHLVNVAQKELEKPEGNDQSVQAAILKELNRDNEGASIDTTRTPLSAVTMHENQEDAAKSPVFDWNNLRHTSIEELAKDIKNENIIRQQDGRELIDPEKDVEVSRHRYPGQEEDLETKVKNALVLAYQRAHVRQGQFGEPPKGNIFDQVPQEPPASPFSGSPIEPAPPAMQVAESVGKQAQTNLFDNIPTAATSTSVSPSGATSPTVNGDEFGGSFFKPEPNTPNEGYTHEGKPVIQLPEEKLPKAEHIAHDLAQVEAHVARNVVRDLGDVDSLKSIMRSLKPQLVGKTYPEAQQIISKASGLSVDQIKAILTKGYENDPADTKSVINTMGSEENKQKQVIQRTDTQIQLIEARALLQDWYQSRGPGNLPQPEAFKWLENKDLREKGVDGVTLIEEQSRGIGGVSGHGISEKPLDLKQREEKEFFSKYENKEKKWLSPDVGSKASIDPLGLTKEGTTKEQIEKARRFFDKQSRASTNKMKEQVLAHHGVYDKFYLDQVKELIDKFSGDAQDVLRESMKDIHTLVADGTKDITSKGMDGKENKFTVYKTLVDRWRIATAAEKVLDRIDEEDSRIARERQKIDEKGGLENWTKQKVDIEAAGRPETRETETPNLDEIADKAAHQPTDIREDGEDGEVWDNRLEKDDKPYWNEEGKAINPVDVLKAAFNPPKIKQWNAVERECALPSVLAFLRQYPYAANLHDYYTFKSGGEEAIKKLQIEAKERLSSPEAKMPINDFAMFKSNIRSMVAADLHEQYKSMEAAIKEFFKNHPQGIKLPPGRTGMQQVVKMYSQLMDAAAEQVAVKAYEPDPANNHAITQLGNGPHKPNEKGAYVTEMKKFYDMFGKKYTQTDLIRWNTQRTPDLWNLLADPQVMNNNILQHIILFNKAQIQEPLLDERIKGGEFQNANIYQSKIEGYHPHNYALKGEQSDLAGVENYFGGKKNPLGALHSPEAKFSSHQAFVQAGNIDAWEPVNDYWLNMAMYGEKSMLAIKQGQLHKEIAKISLPEVEFFSDKWNKLLKDNPIPDELKLQFKKVHAATDRPILDLADHMSRAMFTPDEIKEGLEYEKRGEKNPYAVSPQALLNEMGFIQSHQDDGLNHWYRGSFSPPYVYRTLYQMIRTIYDNKSKGFDRGDILGLLQKAFLTTRQIALTDSLVHFPQMVGNIMNKVPPTTLSAALIKAPVAFFARGPQIGKQILAGTYSHNVGNTEDQRQWARRYIELGATTLGGYNMILHHAIGKLDKGIFPERQAAGQRWLKFLLSGGGTSAAVLGEVGGQLALGAHINMTKELVAKGYDLDQAMKMTVEHMNMSMYLLNEVAWAGSNLGDILNVTTASKNFAVVATRAVMMAMQYPMGGAVAGALGGAALGGLPGAALGAVGGAQLSARTGAKFKSGSGAWRNVFTGAGTAEELRDQCNWEALKTIFTVFAGTLLFNSMIQLGNWYMQKEEDRKPEDKFWWNNPVPVFGSYKTFMNDVENKPIYGSWNLFRLSRDIVDEMGPIVDKAIEKVTGNKSDVGRQYSPRKFDMSLGWLEAALNKRFLTDNSKIANDDDPSLYNQWAERFSYGLSNSVPINPWFGSGKTQVPFSENKILDFIMKGSTLEGFSYERGSPDGVPTDQYRKWQKEVGYEDYVAKNGKNPWANFNGGRDQSPEGMAAARASGEISQRAYMNYFKRQNPNNYFKQHRREIQTADSSNLFDDINKIENPEEAQ